MPMRNILWCLLLTVLLCQPLPLVAAEATNNAPTAIVVEFDQGKIKYKVDSKSVRSEDILEDLGRVKKQRGREAPVVVLIDQRNSLAALSNIRGIINKAGFSSVRYFSFTVDRQMMEEIPIDQRRAVPFSLNPS
jgi:biopolymer transport protein ExbD